MTDQERRRGYWEGQVTEQIKGLKETVEKYIEQNEAFKVDAYNRINTNTAGISENTEKVSSLKAWAIGFSSGFGAFFGVLSTMLVSVFRGK